MSSTEGGGGPAGDVAAGAEPLAIVAAAIDDLAAQDPGSLTAAELADRIASVWTLIGDIDPELARRAAGYERGPRRRGRPRETPPRPAETSRRRGTHGTEPP